MWALTPEATQLGDFHGRTPPPGSVPDPPPPDGRRGRGCPPRRIRIHTETRPFGRPSRVIRHRFFNHSATTAVFTGFAAGYLNAGSPFLWTLFLAIPVFLLWTLIPADLAAKIPLPGHAYQWTSRLNGSTFGWFTGFSALIGWISG